jgi:hypothetical protein
MTDDVSPEFIQQLLAAQGCQIAQADAALIAGNISAQLRIASPDYANLAFEVEPSGFDAAMRAGAIR